MAVEQFQVLEHQMEQLDQELATSHSAPSTPRCCPAASGGAGLGVDSAQEIIAEVGPAAATFPSEEQLSSWVGAPRRRRERRRKLQPPISEAQPPQAANAAARTKGSIFDVVYRRSVMRLGHNQAIGVIADSVA